MPIDGRSIVEDCIRHPSRHDSVVRTLEHEIPIINDKIDKQNPQRARMTNPVLIYRAFVWSWSLNPSQYFGILIP